MDNGKRIRDIGDDVRFGHRIALWTVGAVAYGAFLTAIALFFS